MKKEKTLTQNFIQIPYQLIIDRNLAPLDRLVYGAIDYLITTGQGSSNEAISKFLYCTNNSVSRSVSKLIKTGYIHVDTVISAIGRSERRISTVTNRGI